MGRAALTAALAVCAVASAISSVEAAAPPKEIAGFIGGARGVSTGGLFTEPSDMAVYRGGAGGGRKLFVVEAADERNNRVQRLDEHGNFELAWGRDAVRAGAQGDRGRGFEICRAADSAAAGCQPAPAGARAGELRKPTAIAVSETTGDVYVMDIGNRRVQRFGFDGRFLDAWGWGVASGRARFEICSANCRAGLVGRREGNGHAGQFARAETGAIAVSPRAPNHVFVGDEGNGRVLEFTPDGRFVRGWGWGVSTGSHRFEACVRSSGCRRGLRFGDGAWPRHLAIDANGIVYGSDGVRGGDVTRFESGRPPASSDASKAWMVPLAYENVLGDGFTLGLAIDASTGSLAVGRDPFGPMYIDEVSNPGGSVGSGDRKLRPKVVVQDGTPYLGSVNGIEATNENVFIAKSTRLKSNDPVIAFKTCGSRECNGFVVLAPQGPLTATLTGPVGSDRGAVLLCGLVLPNGIARYTFQVSRNGTGWKTLAKQRYVSGARGVYVSIATDGLTPGRIYQARLLVSRGPQFDKRYMSNRVPFIVKG